MVDGLVDVAALDLGCSAKLPLSWGYVWEWWDPAPGVACGGEAGAQADQGEISRRQHQRDRDQEE